MNVALDLFVYCITIFCSLQNEIFPYVFYFFSVFLFRSAVTSYFEFPQLDF